ncbi:EGF-containing fibulin-like extracellular matrix protein 1 [Dendronephthya gigantea]|nr:EGF-containing fibulin-like extracellular matrix protein 1 [Dendronephthya gigantea]
MLVDVIGDFLYWKERISPIVLKMNVTSRDISRYIPLPKGFDVRDLLVVDKDRQPEGKCQCVQGYCSIINGSRTCHCESGFNVSGHACTDNDECLSSPCNLAIFISCNNTPGSYECICKKGFYSNGTACLDIDECNSYPQCNCLSSRKEKCINTPGSCK